MRSGAAGRGPSVAGLVLAGGRSERLGRPKQLLAYRGTTLLEYVVAQVNRASTLREVVVVVHPELASWAAGRDWGRAVVIPVEPSGPEEGCSASYRTGLQAVMPEHEAVVVVLGDQPWIEAGVIDRLVTAWCERPVRVALVRYRGSAGHPLLFGRALFDELERLRGDKAAWKLVDREGEAVLAVDVDAPYPRDIDTWADYAAVLREDPSWLVGR